MKIFINDMPAEVESARLVHVLAGHCGSLRPGIAVAINQQVIPRSAWENTQVEAGDRLDVLTAVQGG